MAQAAYSLMADEQISGQVSILVVDDRPTGRAVLRAALFDPSYSIIEAENGEQALKLAFAQSFDIVILDLIMPGLDGYEVLQSLRSRFSPLELPVVVVTVRDGASDVVKALKLGANDYVTKPIDEHILNARLASQVLRKRAEDVLRKSYNRLEGLVRDRTAQLREANKALSKSEQRFRSLYNDTPTMFFTIDADHNIVSVNKYGAKYLGYEVDQLLGKPMQMLYPENERPKANEQLSCSFNNKDGVERREIEMRHRNGDSIWVRQASRQAELEEGTLNVLTVCEDITEAYLLGQKLAYQANHDNLTGLINRREFEQLLGDILNQPGKEKIAYILCFIDLDQLGRINNSCGHVAGDKCLVNTTGLMQRGLHESDILARIGGDEFALLLNNYTMLETVRKTEMLRKAIEEDEFICDGIELSTTISIGVVPITHTTSSISQLMAAAAAACSEVKTKGGNGVKVASMDERIVHGDIGWVERVNQAMENDSFELHGELLLPLSEDNKPAMEVLLRMRQADGNLIYPNDFLPTAEYFNMMTKLDRWVIQACFSWLNRNPLILGDLGMYSINLSGQSLADETLAGFILDTARQANIPLEKICFEITETAAIANLAKARYLISTLKRNKTRVALDDFGRGISSLMYLKTLQVDVVKIDGIFIREVTHSKEDAAVVKIISDTAHALGKQTIAEYVTNEEIFNCIREIGIDYAQGEYVSESIALEQIASAGFGSPGRK